MKIEKDKNFKPCDICLKSKMTQNPFPKSNAERTKHILEIVHTDICVSMRTPTLRESRYFITFVDDKSRYCKIKFLKHKREAFKAFKKFKTYAEILTGMKMMAIQSNNRKEYCNNQFD